MPTKRELQPVRVAATGEHYDVVPCPWDGTPAPVFMDRKGQPWAKCMSCGCRFFGRMISFEVGKRQGRVLAVTWPPSNYSAGRPSGGASYADV